MKITIHYHAQARQAVGRTDEVIESDHPITLQDLLRTLAQRHGEPLRHMLLTETGQPHPSLLLFVGDEQVRPTAPRTLSHDTELIMLSPIAGG